jgi:tRNA pseudouridine synthase 10
VHPQDCYICEGLTSKIDETLRLVAKATGHFDFATFSMGLSVLQAMQEREDRLRAEFKVRGYETLKGQLAKILTNKFAGLSGKKSEKLHPDVAILVDLIEFSVRVSSKPLFVFGRYSKPRGILQKRRPCDSCSGQGCVSCQNTGYVLEPSVEAILRERLGREFGSDKVKITWLGSEDPESRVVGPGRPFIVELKSPKKRACPTGFLVKTEVGQVRVTGLRALPGKPTQLPSFRTKARVFAKSEGLPQREWKRELSSKMTNLTVEFRGPRKVISRKVYRVEVVSMKEGLVLDIEIDGGLPIKRLVDGESVSPSISEILKTQLKCERFDITRIVEQGDFEFGKI